MVLGDERRLTKQQNDRDQHDEKQYFLTHEDSYVQYAQHQRQAVERCGG